MSATSKRILVTGDAICDNNYYKGNRPTADSSETRGFRPVPSRGGALLLTDLMDSCTADLPGWTTDFAFDSTYMSLPPTYHAFCLWDPQVAHPLHKDRD